MIGLPLFAPGVNETTNDPVAVVVEPVTVTDVGAAGAPTIAAAEGADA